MIASSTHLQEQNSKEEEAHYEDLEQEETDVQDEVSPKQERLKEAYEVLDELIAINESQGFKMYQSEMVQRFNTLERKVMQDDVTADQRAGYAGEMRGVATSMNMFSSLIQKQKEQIKLIKEEGE